MFYYVRVATIDYIKLVIIKIFNVHLLCLALSSITAPRNTHPIGFSLSILFIHKIISLVSKFCRFFPPLSLMCHFIEFLHLFYDVLNRMK